RLRWPKWHPGAPPALSFSQVWPQGDSLFCPSRLGWLNIQIGLEADSSTIRSPGTTMKRALLSIALTAGFAGSALAADLPAKAPRYAEHMVTTNWTGCYVGVGAGYGMWNQEHRTLDPAGVPLTTGTATTGGRGWFGTAQVGCDYQFASRWVLGAFGDFDFGSLKGNLEPSVGILAGEEKLKSSWAAGARVGYLVLPQLLAYASVGYTQARFDGVTFVPLSAAVLPGFTMA